MTGYRVTILLQPVPKGPKGQAKQFCRICLYAACFLERLSEKRLFGIFQQLLEVHARYLGNFKRYEFGTGTVFFDRYPGHDLRE